MKAHTIPPIVKMFQTETSLNYNTIMGVNPKTEKNKLPTNILHLSPSNTSGFNVCKFAHNCKKICLHFSGNPAYFSAKFKARINRTLSFQKDNQRFIDLLILNICRNYFKNASKKIGVRLNGTSDILWETKKAFVSTAMSDFIYRKFSIYLNSGEYQNIFDVFIQNKIDIQFYDYTKHIVNRDIKKLTNDFLYDLTFSFDGFSNLINIEHCKKALNLGLNVAAAFNIKKTENLPKKIFVPEFQRTLKIIDGDLSDERFNDEKGGHLVGLRFKQPRGNRISLEDVKSFCIA